MIIKSWAACLTLGVSSLLSFPLLGQQKEVLRYDVYAGYSFLNSPKIGLFENGFHTQVGMRVKPWLSLGFDYSVTAGDLTVTPDLLPTALQAQLTTQMKQLMGAGVIPTTYTLKVDAHSVTHSMAMGPQISFRHFSWMTIFVRPSLGAIREGATPKATPLDPVATGIVKGLVPTGYKKDWQGFYGIGGGVDLIANKHVAFRVQADYVYDHLFNDLLRDGRWTTRFSVGPTFSFGRNIIPQ